MVSKNNSWKGQRRSPQTEVKKGQHLSPNTEAKRGQHLSPETEVEKGQHLSAKTEFTNERLRQMWQNPDYKERLSRAHKESWQDQTFRTRLIEAHKQLWQDPQFVKRMMAAFNKKPTRPERKLEAILNKHLPEFQYNGNGRLGITLAGLIPDFVNINGRKEVIEVFGDYWHSPRKIHDRWKSSELGAIMTYNSVGFKCLVIWQRELKELSEEQIVAKIKATFQRG